MPSISRRRQRRQRASGSPIRVPSVSRRGTSMVAAIGVPTDRDRISADRVRGATRRPTSASRRTRDTVSNQTVSPGALLAGRYRIAELLAEIDGARVWRAVDEVLSRAVVVDVLPAREVSEALENLHRTGNAHGSISPATVVVTDAGAIKVVGLATEAALRSTGPGSAEQDVRALGELLYASLTGRWPGPAVTWGLQPAPVEHGRLLSPRQVRAGVPR